MKDYKAEAMSRQNTLYRNIDSCNMEELVKKEESTERRSSVATKKSMLRKNDA